MTSSTPTKSTPMPEKRIKLALGIFFTALAGAIVFAILTLLGFLNALDAAATPVFDPNALFPLDPKEAGKLEPDFLLYNSELMGLSAFLVILGATSIWLHFLRSDTGIDAFILLLVLPTLFVTPFIVNSSAQPSTDELFTQWAHDRYNIEITSVPQSLLGSIILDDPIRLNDGQIVRVEKITDSEGESGYFITKIDSDDELPTVTSE